MTHRVDPPGRDLSTPEPRAPEQVVAEAYESPAVLDLGSVREVTQGNASDGQHDETTQYFR